MNRIIIFTILIIVLANAQTNYTAALEQIVDGIFQQGGLNNPTLNPVDCLQEADNEQIWGFINEGLQDLIDMNIQGITDLINEIESWAGNISSTDIECFETNIVTFIQEGMQLAEAYNLTKIQNSTLFLQNLESWIMINMGTVISSATKINTQFQAENYTGVGQEIGILAQEAINGALDDQTTSFMPINWYKFMKVVYNLRKILN